MQAGRQRVTVRRGEGGGGCWDETAGRRFEGGFRVWAVLTFSIIIEHDPAADRATVADGAGNSSLALDSAQ